MSPPGSHETVASSTTDATARDAGSGAAACPLRRVRAVEELFTLKGITVIVG
jgi:hypothetical protein